MTKVRNGRTTAVSEYFKYEKFNQGIYVDVFPLDSYNDNCLQEKYNLNYQFVGDLSTYMRRNNPELDDAQKARVAGYSGRNPLVTYELIQSLCRADENRPCKYRGILSTTIYGPERQSFRAEWCEDIIETDFCGMKMPIPRHYDAILTTLYGDYHQLPPKEKRGEWHAGLTVDTDKPYTVYLKNL